MLCWSKRVLFCGFFWRLQLKVILLDGLILGFDACLSIRCLGFNCVDIPADILTGLEI